MQPTPSTAVVQSITPPRQRDCSANLARCRAYRIGQILLTLCKRRSHGTPSSFSSNPAVLHIAERYLYEARDYNNYLNRRNQISAADFRFNFNAFSDGDCLLHFRFRKKDIERLLPFMGWLAQKTSTARNRYSVTPLLVTCILLRGLASPARWKDLEEVFGKHAPQLSEIFWEGIEHLLDKHWHLVATSPDAELISRRASMYSEAITNISGALNNCIGFIDGTVLGIARPEGDLPQRMVYNGHKRKHALKFQVINTPDGLIQHAHGPIEGRRHDWTLYVRSGLDDLLVECLEIDGERYCIYGDSGYNHRWFLEVPFQGSHLSAAQQAFNKAMASVRITVEWVFKEIKMYFATVDSKRKIKVLESPVGMLYQASMLLSNYRNCLYPNQIARYFGCQPPTLEDENLSQASHESADRFLKTELETEHLTRSYRHLSDIVTCW